MIWRAHEADGRISAKNALKIRAALRTSARWERVFEAYKRTQPAVSKNPAQDRARARSWAMLSVAFDNDALLAALRRTWADGFALGIVSADDAVRQAQELKKADDPDYIDWQNWKPGDAAAALLLKPTRAFQRLLEAQGATIRGIDRTGYDRLGTALADAIALGLSGRRAAKLIQDSVSDPARALTIAITETNRAISRATIERYQNFGLEKMEWVTSDPCDKCVQNEGKTVQIGQTFPSGDTQPPVHPNCRCALLPVVPDFEAPMDGIQNIIAPPVEEALIMPSANFEDRTIENYQREANPEFKLGGTALPRETEEALLEYQSTGYQKINMLLRDPNGFLERYSGTNYDEYMGYVRNMDTAFALAPALPRPIVTLRGISESVAQRFRTFTPGTVFQDDAFVSTTLSPDIAKWFAELERVGKGMVVEVVSPRGTKGIFLTTYKYGHIPGEAEWLLPRGLRYEVISNDGNTIRVKVIP
jgi:SPP1 gp7 family putative phage head morphogenesis protein